MEITNKQLRESYIVLDRLSRQSQQDVVVKIAIANAITALTPYFDDSEKVRLALLKSRAKLKDPQEMVYEFVSAYDRQVFEDELDKLLNQTVLITLKTHNLLDLISKGLDINAKEIATLSWWLEYD